MLRKVFLYVIKVRQRRERYHGGIKALGEHMHVVTKTMSDAAAAATAESNNNNNNSSAFKPGEGGTVDPKAPRAPRAPRAPSRAIVETRRTPEIEIVETDIDADAPPMTTTRTRATKTQVAPSPSLLGRLRNKPPPDPLEMKRIQDERRASRMHNFLANLE